MKVKITTYNYYVTKTGKKVITESVREEDPLHPERHAVLCQFCNLSTYPECRKECQSEEWRRERDPEAAKIFKKEWFRTHPEDKIPFPEDREEAWT